MIIVTCLMLALLDLMALVMLVLPYTDEMDIEVFMTDAPLEKILKVRGHLVSAAAMFALATIMSVSRAGNVIP